MRIRSTLVGLKLVTLAVVIIGVAIGATLAGEPAGAAFPGKNGKVIFQSNRGAGINIHSMNPDGSNVVDLTSNPGTKETYPKSSSDGREIAFGYTNQDIYKMNSDGSGVQQLTIDAALDEYPTWSPDGSKIAFHSNRDGDWQIFVMDSDGTNQANISQNAFRDVFPAWSPDGTKIAFKRGTTTSAEIYVMDAPSGLNQTRLTFNSGDDGVPAWSPDGSKIAFSQGSDIWVMDADGNNPHDLLGDGVGSDGEPAWSPDGTKIIFNSNRGGSGDIWMVDADGNIATLQNITSDNPGTDGSPDWQPIVTSFPSNSWDKESGVRLASSNAPHVVDIAGCGGLRMFVNTVTFPNRIESSSSVDGLTWTAVQTELSEGGVDGSVSVGTPFVMEVSAGYRMYYTAGMGDGTTEIWSAFSDDCEVWVKEALRVDHGGPTDPDSNGVSTPSIVQVPGGCLRMYFDTWDGTNNRIMSALSCDGGFVWTKDAGIRLDIASGQPDAAGVSRHFAVELPNGRMRLYYTGDDDTTCCDVIMKATSTDAEGLVFPDKAGRVVLVSPGGPNDPAGVAHPSVLQIASETYRMYYVGLSAHSVISAITNPGVVLDTDGDGCTDYAEIQSKATPATGGGRDPKNPWDFYDVETISGPGKDGVVDLLFDILSVINHYQPAIGGAPPYDAHYDRGPSTGPNPWNMTGPDGVIDLLNDILGVVLQGNHNCK